MARFSTALSASRWLVVDADLVVRSGGGGVVASADTEDEANAIADRLEAENLPLAPEASTLEDPPA